MGLDKEHSIGNSMAVCRIFKYTNKGELFTVVVAGEEKGFVTGITVGYLFKNVGDKELSILGRRVGQKETILIKVGPELVRFMKLLEADKKLVNGRMVIDSYGRIVFKTANKDGVDHIQIGEEIGGKWAVKENYKALFNV